MVIHCLGQGVMRFPDRPTDSWWQRTVGLLGRLVFPSVFVTLKLIRVDFLDRMPQLCIYRQLFGMRCPGCGMTHAFCAVLHGDFARAFAYNHLVIIAFPFFVSIAARHLLSVVHDLHRVSMR